MNICPSVNGISHMQMLELVFFANYFYTIGPKFLALRRIAVLTRERRLLVLGPSFRRNKSGEPLAAVVRYDGLFYRVARKHLSTVRDVDVIVMIDNLSLTEGVAPLAYSEPKGKEWEKHTFPSEIKKEAKIKNEDFLIRKLKTKKYSEIFISMGRKYAEALPDLTQYGIRVIFPTSGGPGPKARALRAWITKEERRLEK